MAKINSFDQMIDLMAKGYDELEEEQKIARSETVKLKIELLNSVFRQPASPRTSMHKRGSRHEALRAIHVLGGLVQQGYDLGSFNSIHRKDIAKRTRPLAKWLWNDDRGLADVVPTLIEAGYVLEASTDSCDPN